MYSECGPVFTFVIRCGSPTLTNRATTNICSEARYLRTVHAHLPGSYNIGIVPCFSSIHRSVVGSRGAAPSASHILALSPRGSQETADYDKIAIYHTDNRRILSFLSLYPRTNRGMATEKTRQNTATKTNENKTQQKNAAPCGSADPRFGAPRRGPR